MEFAKKMEERAAHQTQSNEKVDATVELSEIQLAMVGGGFGDVSYT